MLRTAAGRSPEPTAAVLDSRIVRSCPESGGRAGYYEVECKRCSLPHISVDTLGDLLALHVTTAARQHGIELDVAKLP